MVITSILWKFDLIVKPIKPKYNIVLNGCKTNKNKYTIVLNGFKIKLKLTIDNSIIVTISLVIQITKSDL